MTDKEAIELIERLLINHRQTHADWLKFLIKNPETEAQYKDNAGGIEHQRECIADYNEALQAVAILRETEERKSYANYVKKQMATLKDHDHKLFEDIVNGLKKEGWKEDGGSPTYRLLHKGTTVIKVFRDAEAPKVIKICFSAPPEESKTDEETENTS